MGFLRTLEMNLPEFQSAFLWGARQTGKSTFLREKFKGSYYIDLLDTELFLTYNKSPYLFARHIEALPKEVRSKPIIVDEIQKIPVLLNEVHRLIESEGLSFILCGSSARKLRRAGVNLLGGRAWRFDFFPLTTREIPDFDLFAALSRGLIPSYYLSVNYKRGLKAYISTYLRDEIQQEGAVKNLPAFSKFLDVVGLTHGGLVNYSNIASDVGVSSHTVKEYFQILVDTLMGYRIYPYRKIIKRQIISAMPKFYLFDVGLANALSSIDIMDLKSAAAGNAFEHFILMEILAYKGLKEKDFQVTYWRTKTGLEVDFVLGRAECAIEVKLSCEVRATNLKGLAAFVEEHHPRKALVVSQDIAARKLKIGEAQIEILPWKVFLDQLWAGELV